MIIRAGKKILFATITVILTVITIEVALHAVAFVSPNVNAMLSVIQAKVPDERLGHRPNPAYPDHDQKGFRNPHVPETVHVVALGDSQTYGSGVNAEQAWPRVLESLTRSSVYSMASGGYGPVHSLLLWEEAITMQPAIVIEAVYSGNDLYDSFSIVHKKGKLPHLKTRDKRQTEAIVQMEESEPIQKRVSTMYRRGRRKSDSVQSIKSWLSENSKIDGLLRRTQYELKRIRNSTKKRTAEDKWLKAKSFAKRHPDYTQVFSSESSRTIFTSEYRLSALNLDDPRIREGQRISLEAIGEMQQLAIRDGIRFIALLIPTKELVYSEQAKGLDSPSYHTLVRNELQFWKETKQFLKENSIEYIDALQPLQAQLEAGPQPYKVSHNGHPNEHGYGAIARAVDSYLSPQ